MDKINVSKIMQAHQDAAINVLRSILDADSKSVIRFVHTMRLFHKDNGYRALVIKPNALETELRYIYFNDIEDAPAPEWLPDIYEDVRFPDLIEALRPQLERSGVVCSVVTNINDKRYILFSAGDPQFTLPT